MIYGKGKIAFSAAEVVNSYISLGKIFKNVADMLKKAVDLSELALLLVVNTTLSRAYAKLNKKFLVTRENIIFLFIKALDSLFKVGSVPRKSFS